MAVTLHSIREQNARWLSPLSLVEEPRSTSQCLYSGWVFPRPEICLHGNSKSPQVDNDEPSHHHKSKAYTDELRHFGIHDARRQECSPKLHGKMAPLGRLQSSEHLELPAGCFGGNPAPLRCPVLSLLPPPHSSDPLQDGLCLQRRSQMAGL